MTDQQILIGIMQNDERAWKHICRNMKQGFVSILAQTFSFGNLSNEDIEDVFQESCILLMQKIKSGGFAISREGALFSYLVQIAIYFAVKPASQNYVRTKWIHDTQIEFDGDDLADFRAKYPSLSDCAFFSIECRPNYELYSRFASFGANLVVVEPQRIRERMTQMMQAAGANYQSL